MIRILLTALRNRIMAPRYICGVCHERTQYIDAHHYLEHGDLS